MGHMDKCIFLHEDSKLCEYGRMFERHENYESHQSCDLDNDGIELVVVLDEEEVGI